MLGNNTSIWQSVLYGGEAIDFYVDASRPDNTGDGTTPATAWKTLAFLQTKMGTDVVAGSTVGLRRGQTWNEAFTPPIGGTVGKPITFMAYDSGAKPLINGGGVRTTAVTAGVAYLTFQDIEATNHITTGSFFVQPAGSNIIFRSCRAYSSAGTSGFASLGTNVLYEMCEAHGNLNGFYNQSFVGGGGSTLSWCVSHNNLANGIAYGASISNHTIHNCVARDNAADGIAIINLTGVGTTVGNLITNNTCVGNGGDGISATATAAVSPQDIRNNILSDNAGYGMSIDLNIDTAAPSIDYNLYYNNTLGAYDDVGVARADLAAIQANTSYEVNGVEGDPSFYGPSIDNYRIWSGSIAVGAGIDLGYGIILGYSPDLTFYPLKKLIVIGDSWGYFGDGTHTGPQASLYSTLYIAEEYYSALNAFNAPVVQAPAVGGRTLPQQVTAIPITIAGCEAGVEAAACVIGLNSIANRTFDEMRADYVTVLDAMDAEGWRIILLSCQPGAPGNVPMTAPALAVWQQLQAWLPAYAAGMGYDFVPLDDFYNYATGGILDGYCEATKDETSALHLNQTGLSLLASKINDKLRAAPLDQTTPAVLAIRSQPNHALLTTDEINNIITVVNGIGPTIASKITDLWYFSSDYSASGNASKGIINGNIGTFGGTPTVSGGGLLMDGVLGQYFDTKLSVAVKQGMGGKFTHSGSPYTINTPLMGAGGFYASDMRFSNVNKFDAACWSFGATTAINETASTSNKVLHFEYERNAVNASPAVRHDVYINGTKYAANPTSFTNAITTKIFVNACSGKVPKLIATWKFAFVTDGTMTDGEATTLATVLNSTV